MRSLRITVITTLIALAACVSCGTAYAIGDGPGNGGDPAQFEVYDRAQYANLMLPSMNLLSEEEVTIFSDATDELRVDMDITLPRMGEVRADPERPGMRAVFVHPEMVRDAMKSADKFDLTQWVVHEVFQTRLQANGTPWDMSEELSRKLRFNEAAFQTWRNAQTNGSLKSTPANALQRDERGFPASGNYQSIDKGFVWNPVKLVARPAFNEITISNILRNRTKTLKDIDGYSYSYAYTFTWTGPEGASLTRTEGDGTTRFTSGDVPITLVVTEGNALFFKCTFMYRIEAAYFEGEVYLKEFFPNGVPAEPAHPGQQILPCQFNAAATWKIWESPLTPPPEGQFDLHISYYKNEANKAATPEARAPWDLYLGALTNNLPQMRKALTLGASPEFRTPRFGMRAIDEAAVGGSVEAFTMLAESTNLNTPFIGPGVTFTYPVTRAIATSPRASAEQRRAMYKAILAHTTPEQQALYLHDGFFNQNTFTKLLDSAYLALGMKDQTGIAAYRANLHPATASEMIASGFNPNSLGWDYDMGLQRWTPFTILDRLGSMLAFVDTKAPWNTDCEYISYEANVYNDLFRAGARHRPNGPFLGNSLGLLKTAAIDGVINCSKEKRWPSEEFSLGLPYHGDSAFPYNGNYVQSCLIGTPVAGSTGANAGITERAQVFRIDGKLTPNCFELRKIVQEIGAREVTIEWWQPNHPDAPSVQQAKVTPALTVEWWR
jgi:hypothetical protein